MNTELTRQYNLPTPVSNSTASLIEQYKQNTSTNNNHLNDTTTTTTTLNIPDLQDLLNIKADLEALLPLSESRVKDLKKDLNNLDGNVKIRDHGGEATTSGKNMNVIMDKMKIKQESDDTSDDLHSSSNIPKNELSRQAALETIRRKKRREETDSFDDVTRRSESPHHTVKLKKLDGIPPFTSQSMSPTPTPHTPKQQNKPSSNNDMKKKKYNNYARAQHPLPNGGESSQHGKQHSKQKSSNNNNQPKEEIDFVRVKPKDQTPIATFWSTLEPFFRNLTEEDRALLLEKLDNGKPYLIPPLGQYYLDQWAEEDQAIGFHNNNNHTRSPSTNSRQGPMDLQQYLAMNKLKYLQKDLTDENLLQNDIGCGTLTERLLSSLVAEELIDPSEATVKTEDQSDGSEDDPMSDVETNNHGKHYGRTIMESSPDPTDQIVGFEERLKRELRYAGLFGDDDIDWNAKEDDEISAELRALGRELKEQVSVNDYRKKKLLEVVDTHLAFEQYRQVLDNLDSQVEQGYMKRFRPQKSKKRKNTGPKTMLSENAVYAMEKRKQWKSALAPIFEDKNMMMPSLSIYQDENPTSSNP